VDSCSYRLKLEWANLDTYFTHQVDDKVTEWYGQRTLKEFLNTTEYPFCIKEVEYNPIQCNTDINSIILNYHTQYKNQNCNFLAIDKNSGKQIFLRCNDLILFPKYFENWVIYEIYYSSTPHHILEYCNLKIELEYITNHSQYFTFLPLAKLMYLSLCIDEVTHDNYQTELVQSILVGFERIFKNKKSVFEIKDSIQSKPSWMRFCKSVRSSFIHNELEQVIAGGVCFDSSRIFKNMNSIHTIMSVNHGLYEGLKQSQFFNEFLKTDKAEHDLLSTIPIPLQNKNSTLLMK
jgi:hypothetical protein